MLGCFRQDNSAASLSSTPAAVPVTAMSCAALRQLLRELAHDSCQKLQCCCPYRAALTGWLPLLLLHMCMHACGMVYLCTCGCAKRLSKFSRGGPLRPAEHFLISRILSSASLSNGCRQKRGWNYIHQGVKISVFSFPPLYIWKVQWGLMFQRALSKGWVSSNRESTRGVCSFWPLGTRGAQSSAFNNEHCSEVL
jgi:hypothetical protein